MWPWLRFHISVSFSNVNWTILWKSGENEHLRVSITARDDCRVIRIPIYRRETPDVFHPVWKRCYMLMRYSGFKVLLTFQICFTSRISKYLKTDFLSSLWDGHPQLLGSLTKLKITWNREISPGKIESHAVAKGSLRTWLRANNSNPTGHLDTEVSEEEGCWKSCIFYWT